MSEITVEELARAKAELEEAQRLRGWIANSYAQIEFALGDLILRCRDFEQYEAFTRTLPHGATDRVKRVRCILAVDGPLSHYAESLEDLLQEFENKHETRNLLAHGYATYMLTPDGDTGLYFQKWHRHAERIDARLIRTFRLPDLAREMQSLVEVAQKGLALLFEIHSRFGWIERTYK